MDCFEYLMGRDGNLRATGTAMDVTPANGAHAVGIADEQIARWQAFRARYAKDDAKATGIHPSWKALADKLGEKLQSQIDRLSGADEAHAEAIQRLHAKIESSDSTHSRMSGFKIVIDKHTDQITKLHTRIDALQDQAEGAAVDKLSSAEVNALTVAINASEREGAPTVATYLRAIRDKFRS